MGRVALVTGATQGLGLALAEGLAALLEPGDVVYFTGRSDEHLAAATSATAQPRAEVRAELLDVAETESVDRVAAEIETRDGGVDIVFSNAYHRVQPADDPVDVIGDYVNTNNLGTTRVLRAFAPLIRDGGRLIVVASTMGTLHYLAPVLHGRFPDDATLEHIDQVVCDWRDAVRDGSARAEAWPAFINIPSKVAQVAAVRSLARERRAEDARRGVFLASVCPGMVDTAASRAWYDMSRAQTPAQAAAGLIHLALDPAPDPELYGELIRFGRRLPWFASQPAASGPRGRPAG
jgi:NAD(P)-dependent dehydrogenase (short-subunit alcohol dehydrogenase family)